MRHRSVSVHDRCNDVRELLGVHSRHLPSNFGIVKLLVMRCRLLSTKRGIVKLYVIVFSGSLYGLAGKFSVCGLCGG